MLRRLDLRHVAGNPLDAEEMTSRLDVTQCARDPIPDPSACAAESCCCQMYATKAS